MYLPYVYYIRNKITNQYYIGLRTAHVKKNVSPEEDCGTIILLHPNMLNN